MRRIRWALLLVALGLGIPVGLLAWRALEGISLERAVRHQALAERAFDEMERVLSEWLASEEARPFEQYAFYTKSGERSPLAEPGESFVIGAFQIDPDGNVETPMQPADEQAARARGDWSPTPERLAAISRVTQLARETWKEEVAEAAALAREKEARRRAWSKKKKEAGRLAATPPAPAIAEREPARAAPASVPPPRRAPSAQAPGTTRPLDGPLAGKLEALTKLGRKDQDLGAKLDDAAEGISIYSALQGLNRGAELRSERRQKVTETRIADAWAPPSAPSAAAAGLAAASEPPAEEQGEAERTSGEVARDEVRPQPLRALGYAAAEAAAPPPPSPDAPREGDRERAVRVALDPMVGRPVGDDVLLLYRTVLVGTRGYRQGLALDRAKLAAWLEAQALVPSGLSRLATLHFGDDAPAIGDGERLVFQHRFAEPFDALSARLALLPLPGVGSPGAIYALVGALAAVGLAGLFAIYRMVAVTVHFAERRNNFVSAVTHELKTPLTAIRMYAEMLRDGLVPSESKKGEYYGTITDESERLSRLIDNVLEFSRLERGTREMSFMVGSLEPVVREAAEKLRAHAAGQGFELEVDLAPDLPPVRYDRDALLQVLFNLVDNAMKYARAGDARRVRIEARREDGGVLLAVRDFGPGVPGRHLSRIFEPFYRGEDERVRNTKGTGIGLALVRDLAQRMGARVRGDNAEGGGFRVCLAFEPASG